MQSPHSNQAEVNPSQFNDPLAMQTDWTPASLGGASFKTQTLNSVNPNRIEFHASAEAKLFCGFFALIGFVLALITICERTVFGSSLAAPIFIPMLIGAFLFLAVPGCIFFLVGRPVVFDKGIGAFWKGWRSPTHIIASECRKDILGLNQIHALQLISERCTTSSGHGNSEYYSYELNLVLEDGQRIPLIDHGDLPKLREDAATLSSFLGKPVWDAIERK